MAVISRRALTKLQGAVEILDSGVVVFLDSGGNERKITDEFIAEVRARFPEGAEELRAIKAEVEDRSPVLTKRLELPDLTPQQAKAVAAEADIQVEVARKWLNSTNPELAAAALKHYAGKIAADGKVHKRYLAELAYEHVDRDDELAQLRRWTQHPDRRLAQAAQKRLDELKW